MYKIKVKMLKKVLGIVGGSGKLGNALLEVIKKSRWKALNIDYTASPLAKHNIIINKDLPLAEQIGDIDEKIGKLEEEFDALISFAGNSPGVAEINTRELFTEYEKSYKANVESALLCKVTLYN